MLCECCDVWLLHCALKLYFSFFFCLLRCAMSVCMFHKITGIVRCPNLVFVCIRVYGCECVLAYLFLKFFFSFEIINQHDRRAKQSNERGAKKVLCEFSLLWLNDNNKIEQKLRMMLICAWSLSEWNNTIKLYIY